MITPAEQTPAIPTPDTAGGIDKQVLYGDFRDSQKWKQNLAKKTAHKALDIPEDDMRIEANREITVNNHAPSKSWLLVMLASALIGGAAGVGALSVFRDSAKETTTQKVEPRWLEFKVEDGKAWAQDEQGNVLKSIDLVPPK